MTSDIVERLRTWDDIYRHGARPGGDLLAEAADEIERLRAENDGLRAALRLAGSIKDEIDRAYAEVEEWKDRYEAERNDHEATMKHADEKR
jgi:anion-transporting  ArsA/GET3 family ATPase